MLYPRVCVFWGGVFRSSTERRGWMRCDWGEPCGIHWPIGKHKKPMKVKVWEYASLETDTFFWCVLKTVSSKIKQCNFNLNFWRNWRNNVPAYSALSVKQFLAKKPITVLDHPLYSPDPSCTMQLFFLFKPALKGTHVFKSAPEMKKKTLALQRQLMEEDRLHCFDQWKTGCRGVELQKRNILKGKGTEMLNFFIKTELQH